MDYGKLSDAAASIEYWENVLSGAISRKAQAETDISIATRNISSYKRTLDEVLEEKSR